MKNLLQKISQLETKKKRGLLIIGILLLSAILTGISYAYYLFAVSQEGNNLLSSACFKLTFDGKNDIHLNDTYPLSEEEGAALTPYEFTIKNVCNYAASFQVNLETLTGSSLNTLYLRSKLDDKASSIVGALDSTTTYVNPNVVESRKLTENILLKNESKTYNLRLWIDEDSTVEQSADKTWSGKVVVTATLNKNPYSHTIAFHTNGGYLDSNSITVIPGRAVGSLSSPEKEGYNFIGWFSDEELTHGVSNDTEVTSELTDIYAKYVEKTSTLTIDPNSGTYDGVLGTHDVSLKYGQVYNLLATERYGWTFDYWTVTGKETSLADEHSASTAVTMGVEDSSITAHWNVNHHNLNIVDTYTCDATDVDLYYGQEYTLCSPTRENYTFAGWETQTTNGWVPATHIVGTKYTMDDADETIRATWAPIDYGYVVRHYLMKTDGESYELDDSIPYSGEFGTEVTAPRKTEQDYPGFIIPDEQKKTITSGDNIVDYYYIRRTRKLTIDLDNGTAIGDPVDVYYDAEYELPTPTKTGYNFNGWDKTLTASGKFKMPNEDTTIKALWSAKTFTVDFDVNGGDALPSDKVTRTVKYDCAYGKSSTDCTTTNNLPEPTRLGYNFLGWFIPTSSGDLQIQNNTIVKITDNVTATAQWSNITYTIQYELNGGSFDVTPEEKTYQFDAKLGALPTPKKKGYRFLGWFTDSECTKGIDANTEMHEEIYTLYAGWSEDEFTLTIDPNSGTYTGSLTPKVVYGQTYTLDSISREGYSFNNWSIVSGEDTTVTGNVVTMGKENSTVRANWSIQSYRLTVDCDGGSGCIESADHNYNESVSLTLPTKTGHTFAGWTKVSGAGSLTSNSTTSASVFKMGAGVATVKATWTTNDYNYSVYHEQQNAARDGYVRVAADTETGQMAYGTKYTPAFKTYNGFSPVGSTQEMTIGTGTNSITYQYNRNAYQLTINKNGGTGGTDSQNVYYGQEITITNPTKTGHTLTWSVSGSGSYSGGKFTQGIGTSTMTANWTAVSHKVSLAVNGGDAWTSSTCTSAGGTYSSGNCYKNVTYGSTYGTLPTPTRTGYNFLGWFTTSSATGGTQKTSATSVTQTTTSDETLYARWQAMTAAEATYSNSTYTTCTTVECALNELYTKLS